ncbi:MAG: arylsulfatase [Rubripirellula sp.]|nr:arylsulfatase [Rubripirellula sp.]
MMNRISSCALRVMFSAAFVIGGFASGVPVAGAPANSQADRTRPNIIVIMVDDMGYSDIGCYGGEVQTPNIDMLANEGLRFTQFYNTAKCHTTRAELLTGNYAYQIGDHDMAYGATIGEVLKTAGYRTLIAGKWHQDPLPTTRGFDRYFGLADGCSNFFNPGLKPRAGEGAPGRKGQTRVRRWAIEDKVIMGYTNPDPKFYTTDAFTTYAIERLEEYQDEDQPYLLYLPYTAPHYPLHAWPADIAKYRGKHKVGWDVIRKQRFERMQEMGIIGPQHKLTPRASKAWDELSTKQQDEEDLKMAVYCAMIDRVDQNLGRLFNKVKELGDWDNTLILFLSDNGACPEQPNTTPNIPPGPVESYRTVSVGWANASNTPFRKFKSTDYEGGTHTPFIAHWPGVIKPGAMTGQVGHIIDISATFVDITGAEYPPQIHGKKTKPPVGISLLPIFQGKQRKPHQEIYWRFKKANAVRQGDLKVIRAGKSWELYDLKVDPTEMNNLASDRPKKTSELAEMWEIWNADSVGE